VIGAVGGASLEVTSPGGGFAIGLSELREAHEPTLPALFG
jgi:hypothetical protein